MGLKEKDITIIIPSYKETENLKALIALIRKLHNTIGILIVDDSPESEVKILRDFLQTFRDVQLITRIKKSGRGSAVLDGMRQVLKQKRIQAVIEMDADLSHRPDDIKRLIDKADKADIIIGSRYIKGSKIVDWPLSRYIQSRIINTFLHFWLDVGIHDYTNGLRLYNRRVAEFISTYPLRQRGYIALSEIAYQAHLHEFTLFEVPIVFVDRNFGKSKADVKELIASLIGAFSIRFNTKTS